jgi:tetratricopeptide (TPR) repeat protein
MSKSLDEAAECFRQVVAIDPSHAEAHMRLALALKDLRQLTEAVGSFRVALQLKPDYVDALNGLGAVLAELKKFDEAIDCYQRALTLKPDYADAHNNLGAALAEQDQFDEAVACYRRALELKGDFYAGYYNIADALVRQARLAEAEAACRRALELQPDSADAHGLRSLILLGQGKLVEGWPEYEWRFKASNFKYTTPPQPRWMAHLWTGVPCFCAANRDTATRCSSSAMRSWSNRGGARSSLSAPLPPRSWWPAAPESIAWSWSESRGRTSTSIFRY